MALVRNWLGSRNMLACFCRLQCCELEESGLESVLFVRNGSVAGRSLLR